MQKVKQPNITEISLCFLFCFPAKKHIASTPDSPVTT